MKFAMQCMHTRVYIKADIPLVAVVKISGWLTFPCHNQHTHTCAHTHTHTLILMAKALEVQKK